MKRRTKIVIAISSAVADVAGGGFAVVAAKGDNGRPITGDAYRKAAAAALAYTHGGRVTEAEANDEDSYHEPDIVGTDGREVEVRLDRDFNVVGSSPEDQQRNDSVPSDG